MNGSEISYSFRARPILQWKGSLQSRFEALAIGCVGPIHVGGGAGLAGGTGFGAAAGGGRGGGGGGALPGLTFPSGPIPLASTSARWRAVPADSCRAVHAI